MKKVDIWKQHFKDYKGSGLSTAAWCAAKGIKVGTFHYWRHKLNALDNPVIDTSVTFVEVPFPQDLDMEDTKETNCNSITIHWNQCSISVTTLEQANLAAGFISQLQKLC